MNRRRILGMLGLAPAAAALPALAAPEPLGGFVAGSDLTFASARLAPSVSWAFDVKPLLVEVTQRVEFADGRVLELGKDDQVFTTLRYVDDATPCVKPRKAAHVTKTRRYVSDHAYLIDGDGI